MLFTPPPFILGSVPAVSFVSQDQNNSGLSAYTYNSMAFGDAAADRYIACAVYMRADSITVSSMTIGGVSGSSVVQAANSTTGRVQLFTALVPAGTSGTVQINLSGSAIRSRIALWRMVGLTAGGAAHATQTSTSNPHSLGLTASAGAVVIGAAFDQTGDASYTWSGLTESFDAPITGGPNGSSGAAGIAAGGAMSITATASAGSSPSALSAAFI